MAETISGSLADSLPTIIADARIIREYEGTWMRTCDVRTQSEGEGLNWIENSLAQINAMSITETTNNQNAQQLSDTLLQVEPTMTQILVKITDRTYRKIAKVVSSKFGSLAGNAISRLKDEDYLALFPTFSTATDAGSGVLTSGNISAAKAQITSNVTEPTDSPLFAILHGFQIHDIQAEITDQVWVGTAATASGISEDWFKNGMSGVVWGVTIYEDGNIAIISGPDAIGAVHAKEGVVAVNGMSLKHEERRDPAFGGGADETFITDEYAFVERGSANPWAFRMQTDATAPTS